MDKQSRSSRVRQGVNKRLAVNALFFIKEAGVLDLVEATGHTVLIGSNVYSPLSSYSEGYQSNVLFQ
jgi:hypothetical protein